MNIRNTTYRDTSLTINRHGTRTRSSAMFRSLVMEGSVLAGITHGVFCILFFVEGVGILGFFNMGSVVCYAVTFLLAYRRYPVTGWLLVIIEVMIHAILATVIVGWKCYFHIHLVLLLPVIVVSQVRRWPLKVPLLLLVVATYLLLDFTYQSATPVVILDPQTVIFVRRFNQLIFMAFLIVVTAMHYRLVLRSEKDLKDLATIDPLTGMKNRRSIMEMSLTESSRQRRYGRPLSFLMCDIDHFKRINDTWGHRCGDTVIRTVAGVLQKGVRDLDHAVRWGGEEFLLLLPETPLQSAMLVAERLRLRIESMQVPLRNSTVPVTMTVGISTLQTDEPIEHAIDRADLALYEGKKAGRNRVEIARDDILVVQA